MYFIHNNFQLHPLSFSASLTLLDTQAVPTLEKLVPASGPLHILFSLPKNLFPRISMLDCFFFSCGMWDLVP